MLCDYVETVVDVAVKRWLSDDKFCPSLVPAVAPIYSELGQRLLKTSTHNELQWALLDTSRKSEIECAFHNLKKARVVIAGKVLDGVTFMEEFGFTNHHTNKQLISMKQELAKIHQKLGLIQALDVFFHQPLKITTKH